MRVEARGKVYDSVPDCSRALGVSKATVYCAVSRRTTATLGLGKGNRSSGHRGLPPKPVKIGPVEFPSMATASRALGFERRYVQQVLTIGKERSRARLLRAARLVFHRRDAAEAKARMVR